MVIVDHGYLKATKNRVRENRNWWLIKNHKKGDYNYGAVAFHIVFFPISLIGKRVRFKVEIYDDEKQDWKTLL